MTSETLTETQLVFQFLAGLLILAGATVDLHLGIRIQTRLSRLSLPALGRASNRPLGIVPALAVLITTLLFALPGVPQQDANASPADAALVFGPLLYAFSGILVVVFSLIYSGASIRQVFLPAKGSNRHALKKGLVYGLAVVPPILLLSMAISTLTANLGFDPKPQAVFDWLDDPGRAPGVRLFMLTAAVGLAPLVEEALFRGILLPVLLKNRSFAFSALLVGTYFALVHFHGPSFVPLLLLSVAFSTGYAATGSILTPIVMHILFNLTSVLLYLGGA